MSYDKSNGKILVTIPVEPSLVSSEHHLELKTQLDRALEGRRATFRGTGPLALVNNIINEFEENSKQKEAGTSVKWTVTDDNKLEVKVPKEGPQAAELPFELHSETSEVEKEDHGEIEVIRVPLEEGQVRKLPIHYERIEEL